jgi:putative SOS response-associated peptidase YedK
LRFRPAINIAPTQPILVVLAGERQEPGANRPDRRSLLVRWGFIPAWAKDTRTFPLLINARAETAIEKAAFRNAMRHRRSLLPASGFYEWKRDGKDRPQPYWVRPKHGGIVAFAALMEMYADPGGSEIDTGAILTTAANGDIAYIHDRMPVVIQPEDFSRWLDCRTQEPRDVIDLMRPAQADFFEAIPVSDLVNKVANTGPDLQRRVEPATTASREPAKKAPAADQLTLF